MISVETLGAGGGSIAHVVGGELAVGPQSAGSDPGPICYGNGGTEPTVTDANLVLGLLSPDATFAGGRMQLSLDGVREAFDRAVAQPLGHGDVDRAAADVRRVVNANMTQAVRRVTAERGVDPSSLTMLAYGGNGPVHACVQAEDLGIDTVVVPRQSAAFSALGLLSAEPTIDEERSYMTLAPDPEVIRELWGSLVENATAHFTQGGFAEADVLHSLQLSYRYPGQNWSIAVPVRELKGSSDVSLFDEEMMAEAVVEFHRIHEREHTYARPEEQPELTGVRVISHTAVAGPEFQAGHVEPTAATPSGHRRADLGEGPHEVAIYRGPDLRPGHVIEGPAIVEETFTTIVVNPAWTAKLDAAGDYILERTR
jgi:N-methylhydantoinase A